jgi:cysteine protease ATG4
MHFSLSNLISDRESEITTSTLWILGIEYKEPCDKKIISTIRQDIKSRLWFTYRRDFSPIGESSITSDAGFGCMMRSGQSLLAQAFINLYLGRDWRCTSTLPQKIFDIMDLFLDIREAPYSIHKIVHVGTMFNVKIGEWFGPTTIANVLSKLCTLHFDENPFQIIVSDQSCVYLDEIENLCIKDKVFTPCVLLMPLRLGLDKLNSIYYSSLCKILEFSQTIGIIGGRPSHSLYFIGYQDEYLFYLDPHSVQTVSRSMETYQCTKLKKIGISEIDPSLAIGFLIKDLSDYKNFIESVQNCGIKNFPITLCEKRKEQQVTLTKFMQEEGDDF